MIPADLKMPPFGSSYFDAVEEFMDVYGYAAPVWVTTPEAEYDAVRTRAGAIDFSMLYKFDVIGARAIEVVNLVVTRDVVALGSDRIAYCAIANERGMMVDDCTVSIVGPSTVRVTGGSARDEEHLRAAAEGTGVEIRARRAEIAHLCIQGPRSREILSRLTSDDVSNRALPYYHHRSMTVAGIPAHVNRMGFTAELGYEVFVPIERAQDLWDAVFAAGTPAGLVPFGGAALMALRIEAGMVMGDGLEYDDTVSPFECGLGWTVDFAKPRFLGRDALRALQESAPTRLVSVVLERGGESATGAPLSSDVREVGHITMAVISPVLGGKTLGLARVEAAHSAAGTQLTAIVDGEPQAATVVSTPVFDPARTHVHA